PENTQSLKAVIVSSDFFAEPLQILLNERNIVSEVTRPDDPSFQTKTQSADVIIVALGIPNIITSEFIKYGAILIDVGTTVVNGKLIGDIDRISAESTARYLSPVPGGVGPMTVAMLLVNVFKASQN
ncbi:MAG: bifunctional methylenetetrahydrofolate dehydrogenase/methenyltetrahydrofolate cyclohydrolase, partial [Patescibacteria group bacterium]